MNLRIVTKEVRALESVCAGFLTITQLSDEEKEAKAKAPTLLQIRAFDSIVQECKQEIHAADEEKMASVLQLLFGIETNPLDFEVIAESLDNFIKDQINADDTPASETHINELKKIVQDIDSIVEVLAD